MTTAEKADKVFQSGLAFRIWNKPVKFDQIWDIRLFWMDTNYGGKNHQVTSPNAEGFKDLDECLDDMLKYLEKLK
jgi:hypothetical protein